MKIVLIALVCLLGCSMALDLGENFNFLDSHPNFEFVVETSMNGTGYIVEELHSLEFNKVRAKLTSYKGDTPAFDMLFDYTEGYMLFYYNLTGACRVLDLEKKNLKEYYLNILKDHTEYAGKRGHLHLYEVKQPDLGARSWMYGVLPENNEQNHGIFLPVRMQVHNPMLHVDYTYEFMDTINFPKASESDFDYSMCKRAIQNREAAPADASDVKMNILETFLKNL